MRKNNIRRVLMLVLGAVFIISCGNIVLRFIDARRSEMISDEAEKLAGIPDFSHPEFTASDTRGPIEHIKDHDDPETYPEPEEPSAQDEPEPAPEPAPAPAGPKFCQNCGAPAAGGKFCQSCGSPL